MRRVSRSSCKGIGILRPFGATALGDSKSGAARRKAPSWGLTHMKVSMSDTNEPTKDEIDQRARELARRVMSQPYAKQEWPKKQKPDGEAKSDIKPAS